jgi:DNA-binding transcriptional LysR family regulator
MLNLDHLRAFVWAVECGSFSAAARKLGKAQSAVSTAIANLEIDSDVELFDRSKRSPVLTTEGEALLPFARSVLLGSQEFMSK